MWQIVWRLYCITAPGLHLHLQHNPEACSQTRRPLRTILSVSCSNCFIGTSHTVTRPTGGLGQLPLQRTRVTLGRRDRGSALGHFFQQLPDDLEHIPLSRVFLCIEGCGALQLPWSTNPYSSLDIETDHLWRRSTQITGKSTLAPVFFLLLLLSLIVWCLRSILFRRINIFISNILVCLSLSFCLTDR